MRQYRSISSNNGGIIGDFWAQMDMMSRLLATFALFLSIQAASVGAEAQQLFNGKDLKGWVADVPKADKQPDLKPSFIVRDGKLVSLGEPRGHLITEKAYSNYQLIIEYRFPGDAGNCGVLVHASKLRARGNMFPQSIEVQMMHKNAGDFWVIEEDIEVPDMEKRRPLKEGQKYGGGKNDARNIVKLVDAEKPLGEWNEMVIICAGNEITVKLNGKLVNHGFNATTNEGKIALQAEGAEVEFRKVELLPMEKKLGRP